MSEIARNEIRCVVAQIRQENKTRNQLSDSYLSDGRKEQLVEKGKAQVRRRYGCSMDEGLKV